MIGQQAIVAELPAKRIGDNDNDALDGTVLGFDDVGIQAVGLGDIASGFAGINVPAKTGWTRHGELRGIADNADGTNRNTKGGSVAVRCRAAK